MVSAYILRVRERARGLSFSDLAAEAVLRGGRRVVRAYRALRDLPTNTRITGAELARSLRGMRIGDVAAAIRNHSKPYLTPGLADLAATAQAIRRRFPETPSEICAEAEAILSHRIRVFGRTYELGSTIDWRRDPATGDAWPLVHFTRVPLLQRAGRTGQPDSGEPARGPDIRAVWELNRLHHLVTLGRAYAVTRDERFAEEFIEQVACWNEQNPPRFGPNWMVAMEAAIRAVNLVCALDFFRDSPALTNDAVALLLKVLLAHGRYIRANLEYRRGGSSNHYISDLIGLFVIGTSIPYFEESSLWAERSAQALLSEMEQQILPDGVDYEGAIGYHRLVLEAYTLFFALGRSQGRELPDRCWKRLDAMFDFVRHYLKPDGTAPLIGDSDDGRLISFKNRRADDHSYLLQLGAALLGKSDLKPWRPIDEEVVWWFGAEGLARLEEIAAGPPPGSKAFLDAQIFIQRCTAPQAGQESDQLYSIIDCGDNGARGHGSHAHCDALSLELFAGGETFLRDPGTFVYTGSQHWRNRFRSTAYHNTVRVDGEEISPLIPGLFFALGSNVRPRINKWATNAERDLLDAEHAGYSRLAQAVTHRRAVVLEKTDGYWLIEDHLVGTGEHTVEVCFNFDAGLAVALEGDKQAVARGKHWALAVVPLSPRSLEIVTEPRWVSLAYGTACRASAIIFRLREPLPLTVSTALIPFRSGEEQRVGTILETVKRSNGREKGGASKTGHDSSPASPVDS